MQDSVRQLMTFYPQIYFACHTRHVRDPRRNTVLSAHQASVLDHLDEIDPTNLRTLAGHMGVTASTMSITINRLVRQRYVLRKRATHDARQIQLLLTPAGARIKSEKSVLDPALVSALLAQLGADERRQALHGLGLLAQAAHKAMQNKKKRVQAKRS
ncbi:MAG TPA: MarR family winged helix-turn-helix transcriptional regulator [Candidatus Angelobacter sp.]|jgi:DNA-binding MarR family transcriptional regulator|nr:MarR family winged helix-turn-helix transcriptional regulator [Candidatus Angelobacter sp.]